MCRWLPTCSQSRLPTPIDRRSGCTLGVNLRHRECLVCEFANVKPAFAVGRKAVLVLAILLVPFVRVVVACVRVEEFSPCHRHAVVPDVLIEILFQSSYLQRRPPRGIHKVAIEYGIGICHGVVLSVCVSLGAYTKFEDMIVTFHVHVVEVLTNDFVPFLLQVCNDWRKL